MKVQGKTWVLLALAGALGVANAWTASPVAQEAELPALPAVIPDDVTKIVISSPIDRLELRRTAFERGKPEAERWQIIAPLDYPADVAQVRALLRIYGLGVPMDMRLDSGNLKDYQLEDQDAKVVELYTTAEAPALQVIVGRTVGPSTSFVRLPGTEEVYRAAVGPRQRYDQPAADWRDKVVLDVDRDAVTGLTVTNPDGTLGFQRSGEKWGFAEASTLPVDSPTVQSVARALSRIRAGEIHGPSFPGGFENPLATAVLTTPSERHTLALGSESDDKRAYLRVDDRPEVFTVSAEIGRMLLQPAHAYRDRTLFRFEAKDVRVLSLTEGALTIVLARSDAGWEVRQPANMDVDPKLADALAVALSELRASGIPAEGGFQGATGRLVVTLPDGAEQVLELGVTEKDEAGRQVVRVRLGGQVVWLKAQTLGEIERVFGR